MDDKSRFFNCIKREFAPWLREVGFKGSGRNFRRLIGDVIHAINIQGDRYGGRCCVNLGLHLTFLPVSGAKHLPDVKQIREIECEFRWRLSPDEAVDYWWEYGGLLLSPEQSARHLIETYQNHGEPMFQEYVSVEDLVNLYPIDDLQRGEWQPKLGGKTTVRAALAMARIQLHLGNLPLAKEFARIGLQFLGGAILVKPELDQILRAT